MQMFKGRPVIWQPLGKEKPKLEPTIRYPDGTAVRIWFPNGPPNYSPDTEAADRSVYNDPVVQQQWKTFVETGMFAPAPVPEGEVPYRLMPEVPPKREYCAWDF